MNYWVGIFGVLVLHALVSLLMIATSSGTGSFVGLWAMLAALWGIPTTLVANFLIIRSYREQPRVFKVWLLILVSCLLPLLQVLLVVAQAIFRL